MVSKVENISQEKLDGIKRIIGEAFVTNELFHNWGSVSERKDDVMEYMSYYVDYVYQSGELYANEDMTGFIGLEDSVKKPIMPQIKMILKMYTKMEYSRIKSLLKFAKQIGNSNKQYAKKRHIDALMVCVDKECQGKGVATELIKFAKSMADAKGLTLLFDTDMKEYAEMYQHFGCELYNSVTADNGVTRYSLCYKKL